MPDSYSAPQISTEMDILLSVSFQKLNFVVQCNRAERRVYQYVWNEPTAFSIMLVTKQAAARDDGEQLTPTVLCQADILPAINHF